jgi:hypothetical protein
MTDVSDVRAGVLNFREEARGCLQLAQAETLHEVRTVLMGMALGWLKLGNGNPRPTFSLNLTGDRDEEERCVEAFLGVGGCSTFVSGMGDYYTIMARAVGALDPNTGDARRRLYERARGALLAELRCADPALDPSDIMAAQMLLGIGDRRGRGGRATRPARSADNGRAIDGLAARHRAGPRTRNGSHTRLCARFFRRTGDSIKDLREAECCEGPRPDRIGRRPW